MQGIFIEVYELVKNEPDFDGSVEDIAYLWTTRFRLVDLAIRTYLLPIINLGVIYFRPSYLKTTRILRRASAGLLVLRNRNYTIEETFVRLRMSAISIMIQQKIDAKITRVRHKDKERWRQAREEGDYTRGRRVSGSQKEMHIGPFYGWNSNFEERGYNLERIKDFEKKWHSDSWTLPS